MMAILRFLILATSFVAVAVQSMADELEDGQGNSVSISGAAFQPRAGSDDVPFTRYDGSLFGLHQSNPFSPRDFYPPFFNGG